MGREATVRTSSGAQVRGRVTREKKWSPSGGDLLGLAATFGLAGATWKRNAVTVRDKDNRFFTGRKVR